MNDKMRAILRLRAMEQKRVWGGGGITGSSPVMTGLPEFYLRGEMVTVTLERDAWTGGEWQGGGNSEWLC